MESRRNVAQRRRRIDATDPEELQEQRSGPTTYAGSFTRAEIVEYYAQKTGRTVSHMPFFLTLALFKLAVIVQQIYYRYHLGLTKDERFASMPQRIKILLRAALHSSQTERI